MAGRHSGGNAQQEDWDPDKHGGSGSSEPTSDGSTPQGSGDHRKDDDK
ncbi:hypothetical protein AB0G83_05585 [Streptomyces klenkii]